MPRESGASSKRRALSLSEPVVFTGSPAFAGDDEACDKVSNIPALDLFAQRLHLIGDFLHVRVDRKCLAEGVERLLVLADLLQNHAQAGKRPEVARLAVEHFLDVGHRATVIL